MNQSGSPNQEQLWHEKIEESAELVDKETESVKLLDASMMGHEDNMPRIYTKTAPSLQARDYKEPRMILECKKC